MRIAELRKHGETLGREGMSKLALKYINECDGSYKGVIELCGKMSVISRMTTCDEYWNEKARKGEWKAFADLRDMTQGGES